MNELALRELALFAGAGGGILASQLLGHQVVAAVEIEPYCREVLMRRQRDGVLPVFPIWDDIRTFDARPWRGIVDLISAGFPCQPFSVAGKRLGEKDPRNMWPDTIRVIREVQPAQVFLENVPGLLSNSYFGTILDDLEAAGYDTKWPIILAASDLGAPHIRKRLWWVANAINWPRQEQERKSRSSNQAESRNDGESEYVADAAGDGCGQDANKEQRRQPSLDGRSKIISDAKSTGQQEARRRGRKEQTPAGSSNPTWWGAEPGLGRVAHGMAHRVDRIRALGNGQVPGVAARAWRILNDKTTRVSR